MRRNRGDAMKSEETKTTEDDALTKNLAGIVEHLKITGNLPKAVNDTNAHKVASLALQVALESRRELVKAQSRIRHLERVSVTDELTGLLNRRGFEKRLKEEMALAERHGSQGVVVYLDLNNFKPVNDTFGHAAGDEILRRVAKIMETGMRETDVVGRLGGDEFAVLMPQTEHGNGLKKARKLNRDINTAYAVWNGDLIAISASIGTETYSGGAVWDEVLGKADKAMYRNKTALCGSSDMTTLQASAGLPGYVCFGGEASEETAR